VRAAIRVAMAATVLIHSGANGGAKIRNPAVVVGLTFITLGFYSWYWWFAINRELMELGRANGRSDLGEEPGLSMLAFALGRFLLSIPTVWTIVTTSRRIQRGQRLVGASEVLKGWLAGLLWVFTLSIGGMIYTQMSMNKILRTLPSATASEPAPAAATPSPATRDADLERIGKLAALRDSGALTEEEFAAEKARVLSGKPPT
jgi:Domain of unknown function (DUF4234)/Short C-terminal domain